MYHSTKVTGCTTELPSALGCTPGGGVSGRKRIHFFLPYTTAFHALVAFGSLWKLLPLRSHPAMSHL
jgi:hypothetical protein